MTASARGSTGGAAWRWVVPLLLAVVVTVIVVPSGDADRRYDLDSAEPSGYRGLRLLLEGLGTTIDRVDASDIDASSDYDIVFVPRGGDADAALTDRWKAFAGGGGRVVLGSPSPTLGPAPLGNDESTGGGFPMTGSFADPGECTIDELVGAGSIDAPIFAPGVDASGSDASCYGDGDVATIVLDPVGSGEVIALSSPDLFTNDLMGAPEPEQPVGSIPGNAVVAQRLLAPGGTRGSGVRLAIVTSGIDATGTTGEKTLTDFISPGVKLGLLELGVAFGFYALVRGRRHGRVVHEPAPVAIAGSAFVEAVGSLLERQDDVTRAAEVVREAQCRELARRLGLPRSIARPQLATVIAERTGRDPVAVLGLLCDPVDDDDELVTVTRELDSLRQEALHV